LKIKWLIYYRDNRQWLSKLGVWVNCEGQRRPSSSFIVATLSVLEPQLTQVLPLIVDLNNNPDRVVIALGLNFNPETELKALEAKAAAAIADQSVKMLSGGSSPTSLPQSLTPAGLDAVCEGTPTKRDSSTSLHPMSTQQR
ncbi:MAG: DUF5331 domain-containing protein, partial [Leptolyngbyaceae bacterium]|nr:DUF5331 domain-containing protein [Leptolyngbyaceae bacterium]